MSTCKFGNYLKLTGLLAFSELTQPFTHCFYSEYAEKSPQHFNATLFTSWFAVIGSFLTIDARIGRVMKRDVLQNTWSSLPAHYSSLGGPTRGLSAI